MALMDAKEYDPGPARRRWQLILAAAVVVIVGVVLWWVFRYWPEEHVVDKFLQAIEAKKMDQAYGIYNADPDWQQHPDNYKSYTYNQFVLDWGPQGDYGPITSHTVDCALELPKKIGRSTGVIVVVTINKRREPKSLWVEKGSKTITTSPRDALCHAP
ncbi:MAG TPA: hypothetical protein VN176_08445 [Verrucomicrobiae bacterium]|jgi:hypothetical protein|nr:hypothetical protein [Verrucomicrobiae bacterium]